MADWKWRLLSRLDPSPRSTAQSASPLLPQLLIDWLSQPNRPWRAVETVLRLALSAPRAFRIALGAALTGSANTSPGTGIVAHAGIYHDSKAPPPPVAALARLLMFACADGGIGSAAAASMAAASLLPADADDEAVATDESAASAVARLLREAERAGEKEPALLLLLAELCEGAAAGVGEGEACDRSAQRAVLEQLLAMPQRSEELLLTIAEPSTSKKTALKASGAGAGSGGEGGDPSRLVVKWRGSPSPLDAFGRSQVPLGEVAEAAAAAEPWATEHVASLVEATRREARAHPVASAEAELAHARSRAAQVPQPRASRVTPEYLPSAFRGPSTLPSAANRVPFPTECPPSRPSEPVWCSSEGIYDNYHLSGRPRACRAGAPR